MPRARKAYGNRTDLNAAPPMRIPNQPYGEQAKQVASQQAVPMGSPGLPELSQMPNPADLPGIVSAPSARPNEPVTAGLGGPMMPGLAPNPGVDQLRALYAVFPYEGIRQLLEQAP